MTIKILAFGIVKDIFRASAKELHINEHTDVQTLRTVLESDFPELKKLRSYFIAIDDEYAEEAQLISQGQEIAIIPPVNGG